MPFSRVSIPSPPARVAHGREPLSTGTPPAAFLAAGRNGAGAPLIISLDGHEVEVGRRIEQCWPGTRQGSRAARPYQLYSAARRNTRGFIYALAFRNPLTLGTKVVL